MRPMLDRVTVGERAPDFEVMDTEGHRATLADFAGAPFLLVFLRHLA